jgi:DNA-directed RNA polymerase specialized sigma24 family protein
VPPESLKSNPARTQNLKTLTILVRASNVNELSAHSRIQVAMALQSLPQRWQTILWYVDVVQEPPARIGSLMGLNAHEVQTLTSRAREEYWG